MQVAPVNPDRRPLPIGWQEHYDASRRTWYYICTNTRPPHISEVHPLGPTNPPPTGQRPLPGTHQNPRVPTVSPLSPAQQLYASAVKSALPPSAPSISVLTPPPSPHPGSTKHSAHMPQGSLSYQPAQNHNKLVQPTQTNTSGVPMLITKAEAPKDYKPHGPDMRANPVIHTTAALPPPAPPHPHVSPPPAAMAYPSSPNYPLNTTSMTASAPIYQQLPPTPVSPPQNQSQFTNIHHMGQAVPPPGLPIQVAATRPAYGQVIQQQQPSYQPQVGMLQQQQPQQSFVVGHPHKQQSLGSQMVNKWVNEALNVINGSGGGGAGAGGAGGAGGGGGGGGTDFSSFLSGGGDSSSGGAIDPTTLGGGYTGGIDPTSYGMQYYGGIDPTSSGGTNFGGADPTSSGGTNFGGIDPSFYVGAGGGVDLSSYGGGMDFSSFCGGDSGGGTDYSYQ